MKEGGVRMKSKHGNRVAKILFYIGFIIMVIGLIIGRGIGRADVFGGFAWYPAVIIWGASVVSGMLFIGLGEVIKLLDVIAKKL